MLRGHRSIYASFLFEDAAPPPVAETTVRERKGRSEVLVNKRNEMILCRYWYYMKLLHKNYPDTLAALEQEMYLSQVTLVRIIQANHKLLKKFQQTKPTIKFFRNNFPWLAWLTPVQS